MVYYSNEIQESLIDIYFKEFAHNTNTPHYYKLKEKLSTLDKSYLSRRSGRFPAWKQNNWFEISIGCYIFGYIYDGTNVIVEECFKEKGMKEDISQMKLYESIMREIAKVVKRKINEYYEE